MSEDDPKVDDLTMGEGAAGDYAAAAEAARVEAGARGVALFVFQGKHGSSFEMALPAGAVPGLPPALRMVASRIEQRHGGPAPFVEAELDEAWRLARLPEGLDARTAFERGYAMGRSTR